MDEFFKNKLAFAIGTGRCGTKFLSEVFKKEQGLSSVHERNPLNETFHRYCKWYGLKVDHSGFLHTKEKEIRRDLETSDFSFEASAHLSLSVKELYEHFGCKFILMTRSPEKMVNSYIRKGIYDREIIRNDHELAPGNQDMDEFHHFLGRIIPQGETYERWKDYSREGKLAWWWKVINESVLDQFKEIPETHWRVQKIEELDYPTYLDLGKFLNLDLNLPESKYNSLVREKPNAFSGVPTISNWSSSMIEEFEDQVGPLAKELGYEYKIEKILESYSDTQLLKNHF